ncbi:ABC transporter substrate-binding protein [Betaproteobacteria bacterium]|nr:ABC transporter substrate-binding protein [Betaproteobacteria bacterium]GHU24195.1 ABC transporter substrate-binding protein [Betaproteobacteria bacterium]
MSQHHTRKNDNQTRATLIEPVNPARRGLLKAAGSVALSAPLLAASSILGNNAWAETASTKPAGKLIPLSFAWNQTAFCFTPVAIAKETGIFEKNGLDISLVNYAGSTDQLMEALATGKSDAGVGMIHRWLKPLESGFNVKIVAGLHGGCVRLVGYKPAGITQLSDLRGKAIGVPDLGAPAKHFFSIYLKKHGIDPEREITWKVYQGNLLGLAAEKGEIQAVADGDPNIFTIERDSQGKFLELATNTTGEYHDKVCCVLGVGGELVRNNRPAVAALARSLVEAYEWASANLVESAKIFHKYTANISQDELGALYKTLNLHNHPIGTDLRDDIAFYAQDFKGLGVLKAGTDPKKFADHIFVQVL